MNKMSAFKEDISLINRNIGSLENSIIFLEEKNKEKIYFLESTQNNINEINIKLIHLEEQIKYLKDI